jgi:hypothetical protein
MIAQLNILASRRGRGWRERDRYEALGFYMQPELAEALWKQVVLLVEVDEQIYHALPEKKLVGQVEVRGWLSDRGRRIELRYERTSLVNK